MYVASKERYTTMEYNRCGDSGLMLPKVSLGLWPVSYTHLTLPTN